MSKPILWLGPLEELDADFDPLLGRSATVAQPQPKSVSSKPRFDPSRSVFDDPPEPVPTAPQHVAAAPEPRVIHAPDVAAVLPVAADSAPDEVEATDFSHNNDPIPARNETAPLATQSSIAMGSFTGDQADAKPETKKSFFATLFTKREIPPAIESGGLSINEIWAKATPEPEAELATEPEHQTLIDPAQSPDAPEEKPANATRIPEIGRNIWTDIDKEYDADPI